MVKLAKEQNRYCPYCKKHTLQVLKEDSKGKSNVLNKRFRHRQANIEKGYGSFPYEDPSHRSRGRKSPTSKKRNFHYTCKECGKSNKPREAMRAGKLEIA